jgi:hypothetical protein
MNRWRRLALFVVAFVPCACGAALLIATAPAAMAGSRIKSLS